MTNNTPVNLWLMDRPDLISTFTKIELWRQTQFKRIVYIDCDVVAVRAPDELLEMDADFAAAPDVGWPDCFNSGVMVLRPNLQDYFALRALAERGISFDGADQGLLNMHFRDWHRLGFTYNCTPSANYQYIPAYRHFQSTISMHRFEVLFHNMFAEKSIFQHTYSHTRRQPSSLRNQILYLEGGKLMYHFRRWRYRALRSPRSINSQQKPYLKLRNRRYHFRQDPQHQLLSLPKQNGMPPGSLRNVADEKSQMLTLHREPPPLNTKPEGIALKQKTYEMSEDHQLFQPPSTYPEAPKGMYYEVPREKPEPQKISQVFPWETHAPTPTRVFPGEEQTTPTTQERKPSASSIETPTEVSGLSTRSWTSWTTEEPPVSWDSYTRSNAWDEDPDIQKYIHTIQQARKARVQVISGTQSTTGGQPVATQTTPLPGPETSPPSNRITDFPSATERPSLPVTPAPIQRAAGGGAPQESDQWHHRLPSPPEVPNQEEWNPLVRLEELQRRQSVILERPGSLQERIERAGVVGGRRRFDP
ncbi:glycogenin [Aspergillus candidus]|uniref:glycogenin glucosyltransferase n=1 Tax=Aspergillus candidus TaxID=41067 RepID=A0A2I2FMZ2_ASPCN|nr:hypothetical protein BDW47DRAFT_122425 [Aspergillus candidus]PLB41989.1 hypothetical protein BDW47DRAFT_122425 [Aspergillus candidus]